MDNELKIMNLIAGLQFNIDRINCILYNKFDFKDIIYKPNSYDKCTAKKEEEKIYLEELTVGFDNLTFDLRRHFRDLEER